MSFCCRVDKDRSGQITAVELASALSNGNNNVEVGFMVLSL